MGVGGAVLMLLSPPCPFPTRAGLLTCASLTLFYLTFVIIVTSRSISINMDLVAGVRKEGSR